MIVPCVARDGTRWRSYRHGNSEGACTCRGNISTNSLGSSVSGGKYYNRSRHVTNVKIYRDDHARRRIRASGVRRAVRGAHLNSARHIRCIRERRGCGHAAGSRDATAEVFWGSRWRGRLLRLNMSVQEREAGVGHATRAINTEVTFVSTVHCPLRGSRKAPSGSKLESEIGTRQRACRWNERNPRVLLHVGVRRPRSP